MKKLTRKELKALAEVGDGADVFSPMLARTLRQLERIKPQVVIICRPMAEHDGAGVQPYFGAKLTGLGKVILVEEAAKKGGRA